VASADLNGDGKLDLAGTSSGATNLVFIVTSAHGPAISTSSAVNAASFTGGAVAPGEIVTIFGSNLGPAELAGLELSGSGTVATEVAGTRVLFDSVPGPIIYTQWGQVSVVVPYELDGKQSTQLVVEYLGLASTPVTVPVAAALPGVFTADSSGKGQAAVINTGGKINSAANPARKGSVITLYATGEGQTQPAGRDGKVGAPPLPKPVLAVTAQIDGIDAEILYAGAAPGIVAGALQVNVRVPEAARSGAVPVSITVGAAASQPGVTIQVE
jgi:uncharacterized protein (TIGR03437 family)